MAVMMSKLYAALRSAEVPADQAQAAAEEAAAHENRFSKIEAELSVLKWMVGFNIALTMAIAGKLLFGH